MTGDISARPASGIAGPAAGAGPGEPGLVSIVIPAYNRAHLIGETLRSVLAQTYRPLEVLVVDDGSKDGTHEVVEAFGGPVRCIRQPNGGVAAARNRGLAEARGEFVALLDSDDVWLPWKLEAQVRILRAFPEVGMVWTDMTAIDADGAVLRERYIREMYSAYESVRLEDLCVRTEGWAAEGATIPPEVAASPVHRGDVFRAMFEGNVVHTSTVLLRRDRLRAVGGFDTRFTPCGEDYDFHMRTCAGGPVAFLDVPSILYRIGAEDQITSKYLLHFAHHDLLSVERWLELARGRESMAPERVRDRLAGTYGWIAEEELDAGNRPAARRNLLRSLRLRPRQARKAALLVFACLPPFVLRSVQRGLQLQRQLRGVAQPIAH